MGLKVDCNSDKRRFRFHVFIANCRYWSFHVLIAFSWQLFPLSMMIWKDVWYIIKNMKVTFDAFEIFIKDSLSVNLNLISKGQSSKPIKFEYKKTLFLQWRHISLFISDLLKLGFSPLGFSPTGLFSTWAFLNWAFLHWDFLRWAFLRPPCILVLLKAYKLVWKIVILGT